MDARASKVRPISTMCLCFLSTFPCCSCVWGHGWLCLTPKVARKLVKDLYSPPQSVWSVFIFLLNWSSTKTLNCLKIRSASDFCLMGTNKNINSKGSVVIEVKWLKESLCAFLSWHANKRKTDLYYLELELYNWTVKIQQLS